MTPDPKKNIRVRFAPSPTGPFSIGNARTALFNWLFAKHTHGKFLVRVEDTDKERSKKKFEKDMLHGLEWLGLLWEEEITRQSDRENIYKKYLGELLEKSQAYYCFCTSEDLEIERQAQLSQGLAPKYGGRCRSIHLEEAKKKLKKESAVIRFKMPEREVSFSDLIRGRVEFNSGLIGDIVIAKSLTEPLYNFAAAIDDYEMKITHVIRGEDHLSNTPKQILIQEALGFDHPEFAHLPLILGGDRKKLSKRFLDRSLNDYEAEGYLSEAMLNFLVLLGWHPVRDREVLSIEEMINEFELKRVQKAGAIFNPEKLEWFNGHYIKNKTVPELVKLIKKFVPEVWFEEKNLLEKAIETEKDRLRILADFSRLADFFFELPDYEKGRLIWKGSSEDLIAKNLAETEKIIESIPEERFSKSNLEIQITPLTEREGRGEVLWPLRVALSGKDASPGPFEIADVLGKNETLRRIKIAIKKSQP